MLRRYELTDQEWEQVAYGNKLFAVHLDDNCGDDDTHLLSYDGDINWELLVCLNAIELEVK